MSAATDRIYAAVKAAPRSTLGFVLASVAGYGSGPSLSDLLTDLAPFIEAEIAQAVDATKDRLTRADGAPMSDPPPAFAEGTLALSLLMNGDPAKVNRLETGAVVQHALEELASKVGAS